MFIFTRVVKDVKKTILTLRTCCIYRYATFILHMKKGTFRSMQHVLYEQIVVMLQWNLCTPEYSGLDLKVQ